MKHLPAGFFHLICPVRFFKEEEVTFVKHAHIIDCFFSDQEAGAYARIDLNRFAMIVAFARISIGEQIFKEGCVRKQREEIGKACDRILPAPVSVEELTAGHGCLRMGFHKDVQSMNSIFCQQDI